LTASILKPTLDLGATDKAYTVTVEIPGVDEKDIKLEIINDTLAIRGEKKQETEEKDKNFYRLERSYGSFQRVLSLPGDIDQDGVKANFKKGILRVTMPRKDVTQGSPQVANVVFWAIRNVHDDTSTRSLSEPPQVAVVFHGPAVNMISTKRYGFKDSDKEALDQFAKTIREMKNSGVRFEVCDYALKVMKVDPATVLPEIDHVGNGFISIAGYQAQGYSTITIN
jgi:HSP20 family molecular chaperone IbpA/predicted peroxiredoxin